MSIWKKKKDMFSLPNIVLNESKITAPVLHFVTQYGVMPSEKWTM